MNLIELDSGERSTVMLRSSDGQPFPAAVAFPGPHGFWAISFPGHVLARWEGDRLVDEFFLGSAPDVTNEGWYEGGRRFGDYVAAIGRRSDGTDELSLIRLGRDGSDVGERAEIAFTIETEFDLINPDNELGIAHPTPDGGVYVVDEVGTLRTYDPTGALVSAIETPVTSPVAIALDPTGSILAIGSLEGVLVVIDTADGTVVTVPGPAVASELGFNGDGSILIISTFGGEVRLYDVEHGGTPAMVWRGAGADRELSQEEWDRYVPGDEPLRSVCGGACASKVRCKSLQVRVQPAQ